MSKYNFIVFLIVFFILAGCKVVEVPEAYNFKPREIKGNLYGSWTEVSFIQPGLTTPSVASGELLAMSNDTMFLLTADGKVQYVDVSTIATAALCTHRQQTRSYFFITLLFSVPSVIGMIAFPENAAEYFIAGTFVYGNGLIVIVKEGAFSNNFLIYPKKHTLLNFNAFSRYPAGLPGDIDFSRLTLK